METVEVITRGEDGELYCCAAKGDIVEIKWRNDEGDFGVYKKEKDIIDRERRKEKIVAKRRMVNLIEDNGGIPEGMSRVLVYKCIRDGIKAQEEEFEIMGEDAFYLEPGMRV